MARLARLASDFQQQLGSVETFANPRQKLHVTLFFCSHPTDPRPDPFAPDGGVPHLSVPPQASRPPSPDIASREAAAFRVMSMEGVVGSFRLKIDRITFTRRVLFPLWTGEELEVVCCE